MAEYIDKDKLLNDIECIDISDCTDIDDIFTEVERTIDEQPTADVVEVVMCKNCRYRGNSDICPMLHLCYSVSKGYYWEDFTMDNKFCSYGKKRMDGDTE